LGETTKLPSANETHNRHVFTLPQHNLQNISTVSEGGSSLHEPYILCSIIFVLHQITEACVLTTRTGQWNKPRTSIIYSGYKYLHTLTLQISSPRPSFHKDKGPMSSGINTLSKSISNSPAANSVHLYAHLQCTPVNIIQQHTYSVQLSLSYSSTLTVSNFLCHTAAHLECPPVPIIQQHTYSVQLSLSYSSTIRVYTCLYHAAAHLQCPPVSTIQQNTYSVHLSLSYSSTLTVPICLYHTAAHLECPLVSIIQQHT
jgi:hypothetical protein